MDTRGRVSVSAGQKCHACRVRVCDINVGASEFGLVERLVWLCWSQPGPRALVRGVVTSSRLVTLVMSTLPA